MTTGRQEKEGDGIPPEAHHRTEVKTSDSLFAQIAKGRNLTPRAGIVESTGGRH